MLLRIGKQPAGAAGDLVDALLECHLRIRRHVDLARRLAAAGDASLDERREAARAVRRYFTLALPLHVADEEELITPLVTGGDAVVDEAVRMMHEEHATHEHDARRLVVLCHVLEHDPLHVRARAELGAVVERLAAAFERHLALEESIIFPALRRVSPQARADVVAAMQRRRQRPAR